MQNNDLVNILPYLMGGNKDMSGLLNAFTKANGAVPPNPTPSLAQPQAPKYPDYNRLYPNASGNNTASSNSGGFGGMGNMDMNALMQLMAAMKSGQNSGKQQNRDSDFAPTATKEIRASLQTILDLNALNKSSKPANPQEPKLD